MTRKPFPPRDDGDAAQIVNEAYAKATTAPKPSLPDMIDELEAEIDRRLSSARVWTRDGYDVCGEEWTRRLSMFLGAVRVLKFMQEHSKEIAKAVRK